MEVYKVTPVGMGWITKNQLGGRDSAGTESGNTSQVSLEGLVMDWRSGRTVCGSIVKMAKYMCNNVI